MTVLAATLAEDALLPVIMMTGYATVASTVTAIREGAFDYLAKPFSRGQLLVTIGRALQYRALVLENRELHRRVIRQSAGADLLGESPAIMSVLDQLPRIAGSNASVLITGESGTGKEVVARFIHAHSERAQGPFVPIESAALPEQLLESELFGHQRGAFTGAIQNKTGLLLEARHGTVFLDEIGELSNGLQAKLLRVLEERQVRPVGGSKLIPIDVRVIAATNADLEQAVQQGSFRSDLFYRLNVIRIELPPLRDRTGDVAILISRFLGEYSAAAGHEMPRVSPDVWRALDCYDWPGNVRELRNLAQQLTVFDDDGRITMADLPVQLRKPADNEPVMELETSYEQARDRALQTFRRSYLRKLLDQYQGNVTQAARVAGVSRRTMHRWIAEDGQ
jgi:DNA-binding NtrC family response regulator